MSTAGTDCVTCLLQVQFYGTRRFMTAFTSARHLSLSRARSFQSRIFYNGLKTEITHCAPTDRQTDRQTAPHCLLTYCTRPDLLDHTQTNISLFHCGRHTHTHTYKHTHTPHTPTHTHITGYWHKIPQKINIKFDAVCLTVLL
jgi:hypothetical protein